MNNDRTPNELIVLCEHDPVDRASLCSGCHDALRREVNAWFGDLIASGSGQTRRR